MFCFGRSRPAWYEMVHDIPRLACSWARRAVLLVCSYARLLGAKMLSCPERKTALHRLDFRVNLTA